VLLAVNFLKIFIKIILNFKKLSQSFAMQSINVIFLRYSTWFTRIKVGAFERDETGTYNNEAKTAKGLDSY